MHVQMNVADKRTYFTEIAHRLRPGAHFATFEVCRSGDTEPTPPLPWSLDGTDSFLATADELRDTIQSSGFELVEWVDETAWVRQWFEDLGGRIAAGGTQATLSALLTDGVTRMLNLAVAVTTGVVTVHRASFILAPAVRSIGLGMASRSRIADVHNVVVAHMPDYQVDSVVQVGEGLGNIAYEVNGELIVRFSKEPDAARRTALLIDEARLLAAVAEVSPLPVPEPTFTAAEQGYLAYFKLPGVPLLDMSRHERSDHGTSIAATLGELLTAMHAVPVDRWTDLVDTDDHPLAEWRREAAETYMTVVGQVPAVYRRPVETFLDATPPHDGYTTAFSHNDLGIEHVLIDPVAWTVTGVIDWSDAAIVDPAYDFGLLYRDLGPAALRRYRNDASDAAALTERAVFYARCSVFEDLAYGVETGRDKYVDKSLAAMEWLFPA
jgi:aminoglycoside phosphotransferase (APT) family kinase protein